MSGFFDALETRLHRADASVQAALVTGALVGADQALAGSTVDDRHGSLVQSFSFFLVAGINGVDNFLYRGAEG